MEKRSFSLSEVRILTRSKSKKVILTDDDLEDAEDAEDEEDEDDEERSFMDGYASVFNSESRVLTERRANGKLVRFRETISPGAFTRSLAAAQAGEHDIYALWSHDWSRPLGDVRSGMLELSEDAKGLKVGLDVTSLSPHDRKLIERGVMRMSFGFSIPQDAETWEPGDGGIYNRTIKSVDLNEVSPVALPAYPSTSATLRSFEEWAAEHEDQPEVNNEAKYFRTKARLNLFANLAQRGMTGK